uniref:Uncharacterized protein n=1 Tax=Acrobeloides nanus TaxID=290746 RepID=A0A914DZS9_9BILA
MFSRAPTIIASLPNRKCSSFRASEVGPGVLSTVDSAFYQELVASTPQQRNWKGIVTALLVIFVMCSLIGLAILIFTPMDVDADGLKLPILLTDVMRLNFMSPIESMDWVNDRFLTIKYGDSVEMLDLSESPPKNFTLINTEAWFRYGRAHSISVSSDRKYIAISYTGMRKFVKSTYRIYNTRDSTFENVGPNKTDEENVQVLLWNPMGNDFAFVHDNDIYYQTNPKSSSEAKRITKDADAAILNGVADWLYEEEILDSSKALCQIVYLFSASWIELYETSVFVAVWANRYQNMTTITLCSFDSGKCIKNFEQKYSFGAFRMWAEPDDYSIKFYTRDSYFVLLPHRRANNNVYTQIARVSVKPDFSTGRETFLQMGDYDVEKIHAFDDENSKIYFTAAAPIPSQRHLFVTHAKAELDNAITANCITCQMETNCTFHEVNFSPRGKNFYLNCKGPGTPHMMLSSIESNFSILGEYGRNSALESMIRSHLFPRVLYENVTLSNGHVSMVKMLLPYGLDRQAVDKHYPVLVDVYGGPGTQKVTEEWFSNNIDIYFASSKEYVIVFIDGRGSGYRGWRQKQPLYGNLGTVEVDDQIETISYALTNDA